MALRDGWMESSRHRNSHAQSGRGRAFGKPVRVRTGYQRGPSYGKARWLATGLQCKLEKALASSYNVGTSG